MIQRILFPHTAWSPDSCPEKDPGNLPGADRS
jgi:hypothetical protein